MNIKNKLAIFDLDGTLFDTKQVNFYSYAKVLKRYGIILDYEFFCKYCNGRKYTEFLPIIIKNSSFNEANIINMIHNEKKENYNLFLDKARQNKHLFNIINLIKNEYYIAIATTASRKNCLEILNKFNVGCLFDFISCQEDVVNTKPSPEQFNKIMNYFNIESKNTIILEDSKVGLEAAKLSKAEYVRIYGYN